MEITRRKITSIFIVFWIVIWSLSIADARAADDDCENIPFLLTRILKTADSSFLFDKSKRIVTQTFRQFFHSEEYDPGGCWWNVENFLKLLKKNPDFDASRARVLILDPNKGTMLPIRSRIEGNNEWRRHVVFTYDKDVFDFDFGQGPAPISLNQYFQQMFPTTLDQKKMPLSSLDQLLVHETTVDRYLKEAIHCTTLVCPPITEKLNFISLRKFLNKKK